MKHIKKIAEIALISSFGVLSAGILAGCQSNSEQNAPQGAFVILQELSNGKYQVLEEYPSNETRVVVKGLDGTERILSQSEIDALMAQENEKIERGTSNLTNQNAQMSSGGMGLGEAILASAAGAILGSWIGSKLFNNPGYQSQRQSAYKNPSAYNRSVESFKNAKSGAGASGGAKKSGFFGGGSKTGTSSSFGG